MRHKVTPIYGGIIVEVEHDLFTNGLKGMDTLEALKFIAELNALSEDIRKAMYRINENSSASR